MCVVSIGSCCRCSKEVNDYPGLGYADRKGRFEYCDTCLAETGLGYKAAKTRGQPPKNAIWLEDVVSQSSSAKAYFYLMDSSENWYKLLQWPDCRNCSPHKLKTLGCQCK